MEDLNNYGYLEPQVFEGYDHQSQQYNNQVINPYENNSEVQPIYNYDNPPPLPLIQDNKQAIQTDDVPDEVEGGENNVVSEEYRTTETLPFERKRETGEERPIFERDYEGSASMFKKASFVILVCPIVWFFLAIFGCCLDAGAGIMIPVADTEEGQRAIGITIAVFLFLYCSFCGILALLFSVYYASKMKREN